MLFYTLTLPAPWQTRRRGEAVLDASTPDGGRLMTAARTITPFNAEAPRRRKTLTIELERGRVKEIVFAEGALGGEPALIALYLYDGRPHFQLSAVKDGIEYRVSLTASSEEQRSQVLAALERGFGFPAATLAAEVAPTLQPSLNAHESALRAVVDAAAAARAALPGGAGISRDPASRKPRQ